MGLEAGAFIPDLVDTNPAGTDPKSEGDDHLRLIKTCTQGSFPAFVGTQAVPAFVSLTEAEINDAALKSADNTLTGANTLTGDNIFSGSLGITVSSIQPKQAFQDTDGAVDEKNYLYRGQGGNWGLFLATDAAPSAVGQNCWQVFRTGAVVDRMAFSVGNAVVMETALRNAGSLLVRDIDNTQLKVGFRGGTEIAGVTGPALQEWEDRPVNFGAAGTITFNTLESGTQFTLTSRGGALTLVEGTATLRWLSGDGVNNTGGRDVQASSVVQCVYRGANAVEIWGNGIS